MNVEELHEAPAKLLRLRVAAEDDPSGLPRLLALFQNLNVIPRRVVADFGINSVMHVEIDLCGFPEERLTLIAAKIGQLPYVLNAYWHRL